MVLDVLTLARRQVSLGITSQYPGCVDSAKQGSLSSFAFDLAPFNPDGNLTVANLTFLDGSLKLGPRLNASANASTPLEYIVRLRDVAFTLASPVSWVGQSTRRLGVFYVQGAPAFTPPAPSDTQSGGWHVAFVYSGLAYAQPSFMVGLAYKPPAPEFVVAPSWVTTVSTLINPYSTSAVATSVTTICTKVSVRRVDLRKAEICLAVSNDASALPSCANSASSGRLVGIFMDSFFFDSFPDLLTFENGTLPVQPSPVCWLPYSTALEESVETCGEASVNGIGSEDFDWSMGLKVSRRFTSANEVLGCFYATNVVNLTPRTGWNLGLAYQDLPNSARQATADRVFAPDLPLNYTPRVCQPNTDVIMKRVSDGDGGSGDSQVCTRVTVGYDGGIGNQVSDTCK
jgi:hypothetical protein